MQITFLLTFKLDVILCHTRKFVTYCNLLLHLASGWSSPQTVLFYEKYCYSFFPTICDKIINFTLNVQFETYSNTCTSIFTCQVDRCLSWFPKRRIIDQFYNHKLKLSSILSSPEVDWWDFSTFIIFKNYIWNREICSVKAQGLVIIVWSFSNCFLIYRNAGMHRAE